MRREKNFYPERFSESKARFRRKELSSSPKTSSLVLVSGYGRTNAMESRR